MSDCCSSGDSQQSSEKIKQAVQVRYATAIAQKESSCCSTTSCCDSASTTARPAKPFYSEADLAGLPADAVENSFGCGNPLSFAGVKPGDVVLDIGSGAGIDVLLAAQIVGPAGRVIGLDFTPAMIERATANAKEAGATNVEFRLGDAEDMPLADASVDWVISNCVINLAPDKRKVFSEISRVLKPGGRASISDIVTGDLSDEIRGDLGLWTCCVAGAIPEGEYLKTMRECGLIDAEVLARQYYDETSLRAFPENDIPAGVDTADADKFITLKKEAMTSIWSAKVVARKPL